MNIMSHRGYWKREEEKNTELAFRRSFDFNFGTETDVRDCLGQVVISHDMPRGDEMPLTSFINLLGEKKLVCALNIKADGLAEMIHHTMHERARDDWFVFDMSIPDLKAHLKFGNPVFSRMSEIEQEAALYDQVAGIWLDSFDRTWFDVSLIRQLLQGGKRVCVVSSELHGREQYVLWNALRPLAQEEKVMLCTDFPEEARTFFQG